MQMFKNFLGSNFLHCRYVMKSGILNEEKNSLFTRFILGKQSKFQPLWESTAPTWIPSVPKSPVLKRFRKIARLNASLSLKIRSPFHSKLGPHFDEFSSGKEFRISTPVVKNSDFRNSFGHKLNNFWLYTGALIRSWLWDLVPIWAKWDQSTDAVRSHSSNIGFHWIASSNLDFRCLYTSVLTELFCAKLQFLPRKCKVDIIA